MIRIIAYTFGVLFVAFWHWGPDYWWSKWLVLLAFVSVDLGSRLWKSFTPSAGIAFTYTCLSSLYIFGWRENYVSSFDKLTATSMDSSTEYTLIAFLFLVAFVALLEVWQLRALRRVFAVVCLADCLTVLVQSSMHGFKMFGQGSFFDEGPVNGTFLACTLPFLLEFEGASIVVKRVSLLVWSIAILDTAILDQGSNTFGVSVVVFVSLILFSGHKRGLKTKLLFSCVLVFLLSLAFMWVNPDLLNSSGRFRMYEITFNWFSIQPWKYWLFGMGNGSFFILGPGIQQIYHYVEGNWFLWLHNDPLQAIFEVGIIGASLYLWVLIDCFRFAFVSADSSLLAALLGVLAASLFQFVPHVPLFALFLACVIGMCLRSRSVYLGRA